jgi:hypothetical protein
MRYCRLLRLDKAVYPFLPLSLFYLPLIKQITSTFCCIDFIFIKLNSYK